jgi:hypothetical protein
MAFVLPVRAAGSAVADLARLAAQPDYAVRYVWVAVGRVDERNGAVFGTPVQLSSVAAPFGTGGGGDDLSYVICDDAFVHAAWGDSRSGATQVWYSRIPLKNF